MRIALLIFGAGCCADTYEIARDRSNQPNAQLVVDGAAVFGELDTITPTFPLPHPAFVTRLQVPSTDRYSLDVPSMRTGTYTTTIDATRGGQMTVLAVTIVTDVEVHEVCMDADQNDYGTGRCGNTYQGTITISGDATGTWVLDQVAVVVPSTPDC